MDHKKIEFLVVDTNAFIKEKAIQELAENVVTCQEVVNEIKSRAQLRRLVVLPYELQIKSVFPENIKFVTEFSKKTGDYPSLSATDIKVIALAYQLEKEKVGSDHLKEAPEAQRIISFQNHPTVDPKDIAGFYIPSKEKGACDDENAADTLCENLATLQCTDSEDAVEKRTEAPNAEAAENRTEAPNEDGAENKVKAPGSVNSDYEEEIDEIKVSLNDVDPSSIFTEVDETSHSNDDAVENTSEDEDNEDDCDSGDEGGGGWITPGNINQAKKQMNAKFEEDKPVVVACITTDFAMQNVLKQIGLNVASFDGRVITQLRTFILRCYGCFKTTSIMTKVFCPHCGHNTLKRVAVSIQPDGTQKIHINLRKPLSSKGRRFSLPTFKGGKHSNNPVIFADQPMPHQRPSRIARTKTNILDDDYIPGYSPFALRDTTSKSAVLGIRDNRNPKHRMQHNLNGEHLGRRKKK